MICQSQLNVFYTHVMKEIKFTNICKTCAQWVQSAFVQVLWVAGGGEGVWVRMSFQPTTIGVEVKTPQLGVNNLRLIELISAQLLLSSILRKQIDALKGKREMFFI